MTPVPSGLRPVVVAAVVAAIVSAAGVAAMLTFRDTGPAAPADGAALSESQKAAVEETVRAYLLRNPELLFEMSGVLEQRQLEAQRTAMHDALAENADALYRSQTAYVAGNPAGDVTVVEFFDYNCGFCRRAWPDVAKLIESDPQVRLVLKELPILRRESEAAARVAIAARNQGKYLEMHAGLLELNGLASEESALELAAGLGLDTERLKEDMSSPEVERAITEARELAEQIGVQGTPLYLIGDRMVPGAPVDLYEQLVTRIEEVRRNGCAEPISC